MPFREAHHAVGQLVRRAEELKLQVHELPFEEVRSVHPGLTEERLRQAADVEAAVERRSLRGGPARARVVEAIGEARREWQGS
jgi:argininosuccinate lyase